MINISLQEIVKTVAMVSNSVHSCAKYGQEEAMQELAEKLYKEHFVNKREKQEFGCFIAHLITIFKSQVKG